jgi:RNA-binding protein Nova
VFCSLTSRSLAFSHFTSLYQSPAPHHDLLQLSRANEYYPGSPEGQDRILLVSGTVNQLLTALHLVLSKLKAEPGALRAVQAKEGEAIQLRMLVHSRLCGTLIGKGGATIRSFNEDSHAVFNISPPPVAPGALRDQAVCVGCAAG